MSNQRTIRASMLSSYNDCPRRAVARQYKKEIEKHGYALNNYIASIGAAVGTATHKYVENYYIARLQEMEFKNPIDEVMVSLENEINTGVLWDDTTTNKDVAKMQIERMSTAHIEAIGKHINPIATEIALTSDFDKNWRITGHIDLLCKDETRNKGFLQI